MAKIDWMAEAKDWLVSIVIALVIAFCVRHVIVEPYMVEGPSMLPTLESKERLLVNKFIYFFSPPKKGEIVIFKYPKDPSRDFIKRVIATEGETIEIQDGTVFVNGQIIKEPYIREPFKSNYPKSIVPKGHIFAMGDNRNESMDSRSSNVGFVSTEFLKGKGFLIFYPFSRVRLLS